MLPVRPEEVPASPYERRTFEDVVWRLKWIREERLLKANPNLAACLLTDLRIANLIRMNVVDDDDWQDRFRGHIRHGIDPKQMSSREAVFAVVDTMPRRQVPSETEEMVAAVHYGAPVPAPAQAPAEATSAAGARGRVPVAVGADEIRVEPFPTPRPRVPVRPPPPPRPQRTQPAPPFMVPTRETMPDGPAPGMRH